MSKLARAMTSYDRWAPLYRKAQEEPDPTVRGLLLALIGGDCSAAPALHDRFEEVGDPRAAIWNVPKDSHFTPLLRGNKASESVRRWFVAVLLDVAPFQRPVCAQA